MTVLTDSVTSRRGLLRTGGITLSIGAMLAACGDSSTAEPGRVGYAPPATPLPTLDTNDVVYLRTATSFEYTVIDLYGQLLALDALSAADAEMVERFVTDHEADAAATAALTVAAGGQAYECVNAFVVERFVTPIMAYITGDEAAGIAPSDDPARDAMNTVEAMESLGAASYQAFVSLLIEPELRRDLILIGARDARHAAVAAMRITGTPAGYLSPALAGGEVLPDEQGINPVYAIPSRFGLLSPITLVVGAPNDVGVRYTALLQTPADNSYVYEELACEA